MKRFFRVEVYISSVSWRKNKKTLPFIKDLEILNENLENAYTNAEFEELINYFIAVNSGKQHEDPRPRMSFINKQMEKKAKEYAAFVSAIIDVFDGKLEK